jgi:YebC/PmpR family DNA-binding regulatory protein
MAWPDTANGQTSSTARPRKVFTRLIKEITVAAKLGGGDPDSNPRLRLAMDKAREANMTKDSVQNAVKRGIGQLEGVSYEEIRYEGYGPGGAAVIVDCLSDNRTRTVAEVRHAFTKNGGNLGSDGSVSYLFKHCGQFVFAPGASEEKVMEAALEAGAEDVVANDDGSIEVLCAPNDFHAVKAALEKAGFKPGLAEVTMKPVNETAIAGADAQRMKSLLDALESLDDAQDVYTTAALEDA